MIIFTKGLPQLISEYFNDSVPDKVTVIVIQSLEIIKINVKQGGFMVVTGGVSQDLPEPVELQSDLMLNVLRDMQSSGEDKGRSAIGLSAG